MRIAHIAFDFGLRHESGNRVNHDHIKRAGADECFRNFERLLTGIRLRDKELFEIDTNSLSVEWIKRVLGVDVGRDATHFLRFGNDVECESRLTRRFRTVDLSDAATRDAADTEREVEGNASRRD